MTLLKMHCDVTDAVLVHFVLSVIYVHTFGQTADMHIVLHGALTCVNEVVVRRLYQKEVSGQHFSNRKIFYRTGGRLRRKGERDTCW